ncbi:uncharacterized protein LOC107051795 isoform X1 [Gallus gallus]|uniref:uncharacterized protein LOC107051795 isoform X1 n=1 Tax=Gallus gallus TaxID=9031 RepID=UPI001F00CFDA|nr:uncharacterized protein LOC107051795 isoform X1 [Gallus gallus]
MYLYHTDSGSPPAPQQQGYLMDGGNAPHDRKAVAATVARPPRTAWNIPSERLSELNPQRDTPTRQQRGGQRVTRKGRCPREGVEAVRALLSHWLLTRKRSERLRAVHRAPPLAAAAPWRGDGGGRAAAAAAAGRAKRGGWRAAAGPVGAVLLVGPVALCPLRCGALRIYLPAALMGLAQPESAGCCCHTGRSTAAQRFQVDEP